MSAEAHSRGEDPRARAARHRGRAADLRKQAEIEEAWAAELDGEVRATSTTSAPDRERAPVRRPRERRQPPAASAARGAARRWRDQILGGCGAVHDRRLPRSLDGLLRHGSLLVQHRLRSEEASGVRTGCADAPRPLPPPRRGSRPDVRGRERGRPDPVMGARATVDERGLRDHLGAVHRRAPRPSTAGGQLGTWGAERRASAADPAAASSGPTPDRCGGARRPADGDAVACDPVRARAAATDGRGGSGDADARGLPADERRRSARGPSTCAGFITAAQRVVACGPVAAMGGAARARVAVACGAATWDGIAPRRAARDPRGTAGSCQAAHHRRGSRLLRLQDDRCPEKGTPGGPGRGRRTSWRRGHLDVGRRRSRSLPARRAAAGAGC